MSAQHTQGPLVGLNIPMQPIKLPQSVIDSAIRLMGFDYGPDLFHVLCFDFGDGGAIGIWREGDEFCARISLDALAEFWCAAKESAKCGGGTGNDGPLIAAAPDLYEYMTLLDDCENREERLTDWERSFVDSLKRQLEQGHRPSQKQIETLDSLWERATARG